MAWIRIGLLPIVCTHELHFDHLASMSLSFPLFKRKLSQRLRRKQASEFYIRGGNVNLETFRARNRIFTCMTSGPGLPD